MPYILLLALAALLLLLLLQALGKVESHFLGQVIRWTAFMVFVVGISIMFFTGRIAFAGGGLLLFAIFFGPQILRFFKKIFRIREALPPQMDEKEARDILGLGKKATEKDVQEAYRRMIAKNHPDQGGSAYMASKLNEAREVLLKTIQGKSK